jgi:hypothetical protein
VQLAKGEGLEDEQVERALEKIRRCYGQGVFLSAFYTKMRGSYRMSIGRVVGGG